MSTIINGTTGKNSSHWRYYFVATEQEVNIASNTSKVKVEVYLGATSYSRAVRGNVAATHTVSINGTNYTFSTGAYTIEKNASVLLGSVTSNAITHNPDGSKTVLVSTNSPDLAQASGYGPYSGSASGQVVLITIPRTSSVTCADGNIGSSTTININRASSSFTHTLKYSFGGLTGTIATKTENTNVGWTIPTTFYSKIPNEMSGQGTIICETYNGDTLIGSATCSFHAFVINSAPTITATIVDANETTKGLTGDANKLVKYFSDAKVTITAIAKNSSTIKSQKVACDDGKTKDTAISTIEKVESGIFNISCTDSRGLSATNKITKSMVEYIKLAFTEITLTRPSTTSNTINVTMKGNYFNASFGKIANTLTLKWKWRIKNGTWSTESTITATKSGNTFTYSATLGTAYGFNNEYEFEFSASDKLMVLASVKTVTRGLPIIDIGKEDVEINGIVKQNGKQVLINEANSVLKNLLLSICYPVGSIKMSISSANPSTYIGGTWTAWGSGRVPVGINTSDNNFKTIEKIGGSSTHTLSVEEMPSHTHSINFTNTGTSGSNQSRIGGGGTQFFDTQARGANKAHNNLQPYIVCYMWKRTA